MYRPYREFSLAGRLALQALIALSFVFPAFFACTPRKLDLQPFSSLPSIWTDSGIPSGHQVALFRYSFETNALLNETELQIFADTRYEAWVDGQWVGRGPARFLKAMREYDIYQTGPLSPGEHLIAVLVQWAPNIRRSESVTPLLIARLLGETSRGPQLLAATGPEWRCLIAEAWQPDSAPVDTRGLIGPTELLDLRQLPPDWMKPSFKDSGWAHSVEKELSLLPFEGGAANGTNNQATSIQYAPRSIPHLENVPVPIEVMDAGLLSPGFVIGEIPHTASSPYSLEFQASEPTLLTIETLSQVDPITETILLDSARLTWQAAGVHQPDVEASSVEIDPGSHQLDFAAVSPQGTTFSVTGNEIDFANIPFQQSVHAGRRLLLAEPVSNLGQVRIEAKPEGLEIEFFTLPGYVILDLGRTVHGRLVTEASGPAGSIIDIGWDERLRSGANRPLPFPGSRYPEWNQVDSWILDGTGRLVSTLDARSGRYIVIAGWGNGPILLKAIHVEEERYPLKSAGDFRSSDPLLDRIWQIGVDTLRPNMTDAYTDTPWRERGEWWGDAYVEEHVNRVAFGDFRLIRRGITTMAYALELEASPGLVPNNNGLHMLDYTMLWVHSLAEYVHQTQDFAPADSAFPVLRQFLEHLSSYENPKTGLLDLPKLHWSQTAYIETAGASSRYGQSTALNALYYSTLLQAAYLADQTGHSSIAARWGEKAEKVKNTVNAHLYLPAEHRYLTTIFEGEPIEPTPHAQAWPLVYGLVPESEAHLVASSLLELISPEPSSPNIQIYGMFWVLEALAKANFIPQAIDLIKLYYGYLLDAGATTWWETFLSDRREDNSYSHGWGGAPTWFLTTYVLGASQTEKSWTVRPAFQALDKASGSLPVQKGVLQVDWERLPGSEITLRVVAQGISSGQVILPLVKPDMIVVKDGQIIWRDGQPRASNVEDLSGEISITVDGNVHEFQIR